MNATINLTAEVEDGPGTIAIAIIGEPSNGNWSVSPRKVTVGPNERKTITFTNYVPQNATWGNRYVFNFQLVEIDERGPYSSMSQSVSIRVTHDINEYHASQSALNSTPPRIVSGGRFRQSMYYMLINLAIIFFLGWIVITGFFQWNERKAQIDYE